MSAKKFTIKKWFKLEEAARRLSQLFEDEITLEDVINYIIERKLDVYLHLKALPVILVYHAATYKRIMTNFDANGYRTDKEGFIILSDYYFEQQPPYLYYLNSKFKIYTEISNDFAISKFFEENLLNLINKGSYQNPHGNDILVIENEGKLYQILERTDKTDIYEADHNYDVSHLKYNPISRFFDIDDFYIKSEDLVQFEAIISNKTTEIKSAKLDNNNLKIIGAMLDTAIKRGVTTNNALFQSQGDFINRIIEKHGSVSGISKSTLETRFSSAKQLLIQDK